MSDNKHTEGPWTVDDSNNVYGWNGRHVASSGGYQTNVPQDNHKDENSANAHLIAAAPVLLEALESAPIVGQYRSADEFISAYIAWKTKTLSAINKAKEQP